MSSASETETIYVVCERAAGQVTAGNPVAAFRDEEEARRQADLSHDYLVREVELR